jgi:hypothetical protein
VAAGALTATLAVAAHSTAGGGLPSGAALALLSLVAVTIGALVVTVRGATNFTVLVGMLSAGQLLGHAVLGAAGHSHSPAAPVSASLMIAAHIVAIGVGAALITVGGRLCAAVSRTLLAVRAATRHPIATPTTTVVGSADQPLQSALRLAASVSRRGPPVGFAH